MTDNQSLESPVRQLITLLTSVAEGLKDIMDFNKTLMAMIKEKDSLIEELNKENQEYHVDFLKLNQEHQELKTTLSQKTETNN